MENYRLKKITDVLGNVQYMPQKKILWFWWNLYHYSTFLESAEQRITDDYVKSYPKKVEYIEPRLDQQ
jgi:hypothetical protein